jgi:hypothetical protein
MKKTAFLAFAVLLIVTWSCRTAFGQPPPLGPPTYKSDTTDVSVSVITNFVRTTVQNAVNNANTQIHQQHPSISIQLSSLTTNVPYRTPTQYTDRPNQWYVHVLMEITLNVSMPATSRTISISLDVNAFCDGWQTGKGNLKIVGIPGVPYVEGGSILEEVLGIKDSITNDVKAHLPGISAITTSLPSQCVSIGAYVPPDHNVANSAIVFDPPPTRRIIGTGVESALNPNLVVTFLRLKRLTARGNGAVLYYPTENILLSTYTNFDYRQANLTMKEGDDVALTLSPITLKPPLLLDSLVVIANIAQEPNLQPEDSAWDTSLASASYSPGVHTIQISKHYTMPPGPGHTKPIQGTVAAYELTYNVSYSKPNRVNAQ